MSFRTIVIAVAALATFAQAFSFSSSKLQAIHPGDTVVVTGSSSGIGKHAALSLAKEGYTVFACVRREQDGQALLRSAQEFGLDTSLIHTLILDVTDSEDIARGVERVSAWVGDRGLHGLFNNAGTGGNVGESTAVEFIDVDMVRQVMNVNYVAMVEVTQSFLGLLRKGKGRILNSSSVAGFIASPYTSHYSASKFAVEGFSDSLRRELLPLGVKVSILECGFIATPILNGCVPPSAEPYRNAEQTFYRGWWKDALAGPTPRASSEAVLHAMRAEKPKARYVVGTGAGFLNLLRFLPSDWLDGVVGIKEVDLSQEELRELSDRVQQEFDL